MTDCVFCKIAAGDIPCHKVYEDDQHIAFMDMGQVNPPAEELGRLAKRIQVI
jgi:histidine triad (HIT) family protein